MVVVRKPGINPPSTRNPADSIPPRLRPGGVFAGDMPEAKIARSEQSALHRQPEQAAAQHAITVSDLHAPELASIRPVQLSLDHYRLKLSGKLPPANAQGLRVFAGRQFVDIAAGEIVQVRKNDATGEYRATLASERVASGPLVALDQRTLFWTIKKASVLSDIGNVLDDAPAQVRWPAAKLYEGLNDLSERQAALGATIIARGLGQFSAQQASLMRSELSAVEQIFSAALHAVNANYADTDRVLGGYFGQSHHLAKERFADCLMRGMALSREYQGPWGVEKFVAVDVDPFRRAWTYRQDFHGRFFISVNHMHAGKLAEVIGHEMLHTIRINRFKSVGPGAVDFFYLDAGAQQALGRAVPVYDIAERGVSEVIMHGGLTVDYLQAFGSDLAVFASGVAEHAGLSGGLSVQEAVDVFNANADVRAQMAARNADSIIYAAKSLQHLHQARAADNQLLNSLIND